MATIKRNSISEVAALNLASFGFNATGMEERDVGLITELATVTTADKWTLTFDDLVIPDPIVAMKTLAERLNTGSKRRDITVQQRSRIIARYNVAAIAYAEAMAALYAAEAKRTLVMLSKQTAFRDWTFKMKVVEKKQLSRDDEYKGAMPCASYTLSIQPPLDNKTLDEQIDELLELPEPEPEHFTRKPDGTEILANGADHSA